MFLLSLQTQFKNYFHKTYIEASLFFSQNPHTMKHHKLIALANPKAFLSKKELRQIKGGIGNDDIEAGIGNDDIETNFIGPGDLDNI